MKVKICGLTRERDIQVSVNAGADAIGLVFVGASPRNLPVDKAVRLARSVPPFVVTVGLFLDPDEAMVSQVLQTVPIDLIQFHGREPASFCRQFGRRYIKAIAIEDSDSIRVAEAQYADATGLLLDSHAPGEPGGTGRVFDWNLIRPGRKPLILAGGLNPDNVAQAVSDVGPWGVDVSSGVESSPGIKDAGRIRRFLAAAKGPNP